MEYVLPGINGIDGVDPPIPKNSTVAISLWESLRFVYNTTTDFNVTDEDGGLLYNYLSIRVFGRNATKPGDGGHGGVGGIGGYAGTRFINRHDKSHDKFSIFANPGKFNFKRVQYFCLNTILRSF